MNQILTLYIIFQSLLFAIALISKQKPENRPLALYFIYLFFVNLLLLIGAHFSNNELVQTSYEFIALCRTALVFYFFYSILERPIPKLLQWLWLLPVLNLLVHYSFKVFGIDLYKLDFYEHWYLSFSVYTKILFVLLLLWKRNIFKEEIMENNQSEKHSQLLKLYWGNYFFRFNLILSCFSLLYLVLTLANGRVYTIQSSLFIYSAEGYNIIYQGFTSLFLFVFGYLALRSPLVFTTPLAGSPLEHRIIEIVLPEEEKKFQKQIELTEEQKKQYALVLNKLMEEDKVYLDPELSLSRLAKLSGISSRQLSQFIQFMFHKKYTEYVNTYRTIYAQKLLVELNISRYSMYSIAFDSGFNSETYFYTVFKQQTGLTPKQYQDKFKDKP